MILLKGFSIDPGRKLPAESLSLNLKERESTATLVPTDASGIDVGAWVADDTDPGKGMVYRVRSIGNAFATRTNTLNLEHIVNTLRDDIIWGEVKPGTISGNESDTTVTAKKAITYILGCQTTAHWTLGTFEYSDVYGAYSFDGDTLFDALETVSESLEDCWWSYDTTVYPFKLNIKRRPADPECEMRAGRNLTTISRTIDKSGMYTRLYPIGKDDLHLSEEYVQENTKSYGVISKTETNTSLDTEETLREWAGHRLHNHAEPIVSVIAEGLELSKATGEKLDKLTLGTVVRIPLPEYGTTVNGIITEANYPDKAREPERVKITICNRRNDVSTFIADIIKSGGKSARTSTRKDKEDLAWFEDTNDHVAMCAKGIIGVDANGNPNWVRLSQLVVDGEGIHASVTSLQGEMVIAKTAIEMNEEAISLEATKRGEGDAELSGRISVTAEAIDLEVTRASEAEGKLDGRITVEAGRIEQVVTAVGTDGEVTAASIVLAINSAGESEARIDAQKVYIGNQKSTTVINGKCKLSDVTADYIDGKIAELAMLHGVSGSFTGSLRVGSTLYFGSDPTDVTGNAKYSIKDLQLSLSGNTYTLQKKSFLDSDWQDVGTFSRATSLSGTWSGGLLTVTASPQGNEFKRNLIAASPTWAADKLSCTIDIKAQYGSQFQYIEDTGEQVWVDTTEAWQKGWDDAGGGSTRTYDDGWTAAYNKVTVPVTTDTNHDSIVIKTPPATVDGAADSKTYILGNQDNNHVDLQYYDGSNYITVARITHSKYNSGWTAAYNKVVVPVTTDTNHDSIVVKTPPATVDGAAESRTYILGNADKNHVDLQYYDGSNYTTVCRISHGKYNAGWNAAYGKVTIPLTTDTNHDSIVVKVPVSTVDAAAGSYTYILGNADNNHVDLQYFDGTNYVTVCRKSHGKYNAGWTAAYNKVSVPTTKKTNTDSIVVKTPPSTVGGSAESRTYILGNADNNHVDLQYYDGSAYTTVCRITHGKYNAGWTAAADKVTVPTSQVTNKDSIVVKVPPTTVGGSAASYTYILDNSAKNYADLQYYNSSDKTYTTVARLSHNRYNGGWNAAYKKVSVPTSSATNTDSMTVKTPPSTVDGTADSRTFILSVNGNNTMDIVYYDGSKYITVARKSHGKYNAGWAAAVNKVTVPTAEKTNTDSIVVKVPPATVDGSAASYTYILSNSAKNYADLQYYDGSAYTTVARITHNRYKGGWTAAYGKVVVPTSTDTNHDSIVVKTPPATVDGTANSYTFILTNADNNHVDLSYYSNGTYTTVCRKTHGKYNTGWYDFYHAGSDKWSGCWTGDGTHGSTAGKHYVTGPADTPSGGWTTYYCIETIADEAGCLEKHKKSGVLVFDRMSSSTQGGVTVYTYYYHQSINSANPIVGEGSKTVFYEN